LEERLNLLDELVAAGVDPSRMMPGTGCCSIMETVKLTTQAAHSELFQRDKLGFGAGAIHSPVVCSD
jgi:hypothetical protein